MGHVTLLIAPRVEIRDICSTPNWKVCTNPNMHDIYRILVAIQTSENWEQTLLDFVPGGSVDHIRGGGCAGGRGTWW